MSERKGRGRPRPEVTIARDEEIFAFLTESGQANRVSIAAAFGVNVNIVYLSLSRLRKDGRVRTVRDGKRHLWSAV